MGALGTPTQWWNTLKNPSLWLNTKSYSDWNQEMTADVDDIAAAERAQAEVESANADRQAKAKAAADKIVADQAKADKEAEEAQTLLGIRRRSSKSVFTNQGALGVAPVQLKTLLGT
jgi:hypothetical protein